VIAATSRTSRRIAAGLAIAVAIGLVPAAALPQSASAVGQEYQPVAGAGSTWSANALQQWIRNVYDNYRWKVTYDDQGSSAGRNLFAQGTKDFAVSEIPYALSGSDAPDARPTRQFAYVPIVAGGTAFMYNLVIGGQRVTNLRLSGEVVAKIFTGVITKWNDPAIAADNPKLALPAIQIVPVVRSDGSGTTAQLTTWMRAQYPAIWNAYCARAQRANCGITSNYPIIPGSAFIGQQGSNNVSGLVAQDKSVGAITYVEASYAINARFPVAKLLNAAGYYTEPTASNVAVSLLSAVINRDEQSPDYLTANLSNVYNSKDPRTYPLSSYSYMIIPTALEGSFTEDKGLTLADFSAYFLCEGQQQAEVLGYSPLPVNLAAAGLEQVLRIPGGNPANKSISNCNNPTFSPDGTNKLANEAPQPQACDKRGADQCLTGTGGASGTATQATGGGSSGSGSGGTSTGAESALDGELTTESAGGAVGLTGVGSPVVAGSPQELPERGVPVATVFLMLLAAALVLGVVTLPPIFAKRRAALAAAGVPRGPTARPPQRPTATAPRRLLPRINLPSSLRKGGRAVPPSGDS
jgi:phosphate ABC transporter phosphate-binding protein